MNSTETVARAFAEALAEGIGPELVDDRGEALSISVPLESGGQSTLSFNEATNTWMLGVECSLTHLSDETLETYLEDLLTRTNTHRFLTGEVAGLTASGDLSRSVPLPRTASEQDIAALLEGLLALDAAEEGAASGQPDDHDPGINPMDWLRV